MSHLTKPAARLLLGLSALPAVLLLPTSAAADTGAHRTKAQIEYAERQAASSAPSTQAQSEYAERQAAGTTAASLTRGHAGSRSGGSDNDAAAWQLALSAALGAAVTGGALVTAHQVAQHRRPLAS